MIRDPRPAIVTGQRSAGRRRRAASPWPSGRRTAGRSTARRRAGRPPSFCLDAVGQGQVDVVAAEHQVVADGHAAEAGAGRGLDHGDQAEVGRPAADVADQDQLAAADLALPALLVRDDPAVEGGLRLLEQGDRREPRALGRLEGQLAGRLVERGGDGQDDLLLLEPVLGVVPGEGVVPGVADVAQEVGRGLDGRDLARPGRARPRGGCRPRDRPRGGRASSWRWRRGGRARAPPGCGRTRRRSGRRPRSRAAASAPGGSSCGPGR